MARRLSLDDKLAELRGRRNQEPSPALTAELKKSLDDKSNLVVALAAAIVADARLAELAADCERAFDRFLKNPAKDDKLCRAKLAIVQALDKLEYDRAEIFQKAGRHVQWEPVWGGQEDTAAPLRAAAIFALARIGDPRELPLLVDALADPQKDVRIAAAQALVTFANEGGGWLLRFKARIGDPEVEVVTECLSGLLTIDARENLRFVCGFLDHGWGARAEAAVLALGRSRIAEALDPLRSFWQQASVPSHREQILLAISMLRHPAAMEFLVGLIASELEHDATAALFALKIHNYDARLCERIAAAVAMTESPALKARFDRDFRRGE